MASGADFRSRITLEGGDKIATDLKRIGTEGDAAFNTVGKAADASTASVNSFAKATDSMARQMAALRGAASRAGSDLANIGKHASNFGSALGDVANNIIPRFREVVGLASVGGIAGFFKLFEATAKWGHELEENSKLLGLTPGQFGLIAKAAKQAGVDVDTLTGGMLRFGNAMEKAGDERKKLFGELAKDVLGAGTPVNQAGISVVRGGIGSGDIKNELDQLKNQDAIANLQKQIRNFNAGGFVTPENQRQLRELKLQLELLERQADNLRGGSRLLTVPNLGDFKEQATEAYAALRAMNAIPKTITLQSWLNSISQKLMAGGEAAAKVREDLNKIGANLPATKLGEQIDQALPGFKDLFAQLKIPLFDQATGGLRRLDEVFGDFLDRFKDKTPAEQARLVLQNMGRGALDLIPIMQKGRKGLFEFFDAMKAAGGTTKEFDDEIAKLNEANRAINRLDGAITALRKSFVAPFADVFTPILNTMAQSLTGSQSAVKAWATGIANDMKAAALDIQAVWQGAAPTTDFGKGFKEALDAITLAIGFVQQAFAGLTVVMEPVASVLNAILGTDYSARTYALAAAMLYFSGILPALVVGLKAVGAALAFMTTTPVGIALTALGLIALTIYQNWDKLVPLFNAVWKVLVDLGNYISTSLTSVWDTVFSTWTALWTNFTNFVQRQVQTMIGWINAIRNLLPGGAAGQPVPVGGGMAMGGQVPGSGTGDSFPAMLTPGEFVMRKSVVDALGAPFFAAINRGMGSFLPRTRFATGGIVATGDVGGAPVHLHLGGQEFALSGHGRVVDALVVEARRQQVRSAGVKPSWFAGRPGG